MLYNKIAREKGREYVVPLNPINYNLKALQEQILQYIKELNGEKNYKAKVYINGKEIKNDKIKYKKI